jgi:hypothetical protein
MALAVSVILARPAEAHRLEADYHVLPDHRIQVESWFDLTGESPKDARVQVFTGNGDLIAQGNLDEDGIFVFGYADKHALRVVVSAGEHRKELAIPAEALAAQQGTSGQGLAPGGGASSVGSVPLSDRSPRTSFKDVLLGVALILSAAAFILAVRNGRLLALLKRQNTNQH